MIRICSIIFALLISLSSINAIFKEVSCPQFANATNPFELESFMGPWFEIARTADIDFEHGNCVNAYFQLNANKTVNVSIEELIEGEYQKFQLVANPFDLDTLTFKLTSSDRILMREPLALNYQILATDYDNYAYIYSCKDVEGGRNKYFWILLRRDSEFRDLLEEALKFLADNYDVNRDNLAYRGSYCM